MNYAKQLLMAAALTATTASAQPKAPAAMEQQVERTLQKMTLKEKVGQMMQLVTDLFGTNDANGQFDIDMRKTDSLFANYKIGSILNAPNTVAPTAQQWEGYIARLQKSAMRHTGIPCVFGLDQNHGSTYTQGGTLFGHNINVAATFNRSIARRSAEATAYETRAVSVPWTFNPTVDLGRDARWPRLYENFGEDAYLNAEMGREMVVGFQGEDPNKIDQYHIAACLKHYLGYGTPWSGKDRTPAYIAPAQLREKHFAPFLEGIRAGALSVMVNSASVNGLPVHANPELLTRWLKSETGWDGVLVTDWADVNNLWSREMIARDKKEALCIAINAGIDMVMEPYNADACPLLEELANEGRIPMSRIDDAVRRVLRMKHRLGLFDNPAQKLKRYPKFGGEEFARLAYEGAVESMVLLKNEGGMLPLRQGQRILVTGPNANTMRVLDGGWSYTWQGHRTEEFASEHNTIYEAVAQRFGQDNVTLCQGVTYNERGKYWEENAADIQAAVKAAEGVDVILACIGENSYTETPGNLTDLNLSRQQKDLVLALQQTGKPVVLVLSEGRPRLIPELVPGARAVVSIMLPGNRGGDALASLLAGDENFSGRLPFTYPSEINSLTNYDFKKSEEVGTMEGAYDYNARVVQQWGFGHGLSYTTFAYKNLRVSKQTFDKNDVLTLAVDVTNTGGVKGKESVLFYTSDVIATMTPDGRRLRAFEKVELAPGETRTVQATIKASDLAFVGYDGRWTLEQGDFIIMAADQRATVTCSETYTWDTANK